MGACSKDVIMRVKVINDYKWNVCSGIRTQWNCSCASRCCYSLELGQFVLLSFTLSLFLLYGGDLSFSHSVRKESYKHLCCAWMQMSRLQTLFVNIEAAAWYVVYLWRRLGTLLCGWPWVNPQQYLLVFSLSVRQHPPLLPLYQCSIYSRCALHFWGAKESLMGQKKKKRNFGEKNTILSWHSTVKIFHQVM